MVRDLHRTTHHEHAEREQDFGQDLFDAELLKPFTGHRWFLAPLTRNVLFVAERDDAFAGHILVHPMKIKGQGAVLHISDVSVSADARGRGVGRALVAWAERHGAVWGFPAMLAQIWPGNSASLDLFEALRDDILQPKDSALVTALKAIPISGDRRLLRWALFLALFVVTFVLTQALLRQLC